MYRTILLAYDGSRQGREALDQGPSWLRFARLVSISSPSSPMNWVSRSLKRRHPQTCRSENIRKCAAC